VSEAFVKQTSEAARKANSRIVLALDPVFNPYEIKLHEKRSKERLNVRTGVQDLLAELNGLITGVKIGLPAIFGLGLDHIEEIIKSSRESYFFICDSKMADIGHINRLVAKQLFEVGFDALIVHAAIGNKEAIDQVVKLANEKKKGVLGLCAMSHPGAAEHLNKYLDELLDIATSAEVDGFVLPATYLELITRAKKTQSSKLVFTPGVGTQGAPFGSALKAGADFEIIGRSIAQAPSPKEKAKEILEVMRK